MIRKYWYVGGYVMLAIVIAIVIFWVLPVSAAAPEEADKNCVHVATANNIKIYRCIDEDANYEFYTNQLGFLMPRPN